ncbi:MAG: hypothetical protein M1522_07290 [Actinobacteria bacterium]|nr:hypothetical protein [Actinomycetota bacterium]
MSQDKDAKIAATRSRPEPLVSFIGRRMRLHRPVTAEESRRLVAGYRPDLSVDPQWDPRWAMARLREMVTGGEGTEAAEEVAS